MSYDHINKSDLTIISGPHAAQSTYIKKLTRCGNPDILIGNQPYDLSDGTALVPRVYAELAEGQKYGEPVVYADRVEVPVIVKSADDILLELNQRIEQMDFAARSWIDKHTHWSAAPMIYDKANKDKPKSKAIKQTTEQIWLTFYTRKAQLQGGAVWDDSMLDFSEIQYPYTIQEAMQE